MNAKLIFVLVLAVLLTSCNGETVPPVTIEPTAVIPTEIPSPTPTEVPTAVPTEVPTPTATPEPTVWEIAQTMRSECSEPMSWPPQEYGSATINQYMLELRQTVLSRYPEFSAAGSDREALWNVSTQDVFVAANNGQNHNPFAVADYAVAGYELYYGFWGDAYDDGMELEQGCFAYALAVQAIAENSDRDGILVGEAFLFYEVGGTEPLVLDGELREVRFVFPPAP